MKKRLFPLMILLLVALFAAWPLLTPGFIPTHDGEYHLVRFYEFDKNIKAGVFFPRWASRLNSGFGLPLFNFFYPLPNYVAEFFHLWGFSFVDCLRLTLAAGLILSAFFAYFWLAEVWGAWGGVMGAIFYLLAPYHLVDVYVRGSVGEVWALVWFPATLWATGRLVRTGNKVFLFLGSLFFAFVILSHNILAMVFTPFFLSYLVFLILIAPRTKKSLITYYLSLITFSGLGLSAYFWLPALVEAKYVTGLRMVDIASHFPTLFQLIFPSWGTGFSEPGAFDPISFQIGIPHLLVLVSTLLFLFLGEKKNKAKPYLFFFLIWTGGIVFLLLEFSLPLWRAISLMSFLQYPWRFLSLVILLTSFLAGSLVLWKKGNRALILIFLCLALVFYGRYTRPIKYPPRSDDFYLSNPTWTNGTATLSNGFNTIWMKNQPKMEEGEIIFPQKDCWVEKMFENPVEHVFQVNCSKSTEIQLKIAYFPGWEVLIDGRGVPINFDDGLISFQTPVGEHFVKAEFRETAIRTLANRISFLSLLFLAGMAILGRRKDESRH